MLIDGLKIDALSDTHNRHKKIQMFDGDIVIHSGDATGQGLLSETIHFLNWYSKLNYKHKIFVPGNHDRIFEENPTLMADECAQRGIILLNDSGCEIEGIKIWGSPVQPWFYDWAFNRRRTEKENKDYGGGFIKDHWDLIPVDTEILVTHGPPKGILDYVPKQDGLLEEVGCYELTKRLYETKVKLHIFGHIHYAAGYRYIDGRTYVNASMLNEQYTPSSTNPRRIIRDIAGDYYVEEPIL